MALSQGFLWCVHDGLFASRYLNQLLEEFLIVTFDLRLLHRLFILVDPLLIAEKPLLVILTELSLFLSFRSDLFTTSNVC